MSKMIAWIDDVNILTVIYENIDETLNRHGNHPNLYWKQKQKYFTTSWKRRINQTTAQLEFFEELPIGEQLVLLWGDKQIPVYPRAIVRTEWFDRKYAAIDTTLGAICTPTQTAFSIWAPTALSIKLLLAEKTYSLKQMGRGVWNIEITGDWHGHPYQYEITVNGKTQLINDPYAKSMHANSEKGVIIDFSRTSQPSHSQTHKRPAIEQLQDAIIYELHMRDATIGDESGVLNRGKYLGLAEKGTTTTNGLSSGLSYIKELGCTHVQLLPINDFARVDELHPEKQYNWGYDPLNFQALEGSYSVLPDKPIARINEFKALIHAFHQENIAVIIDVVFNHVFIMEESAFAKIIPGYYFRYHENGEISNGTGVGNDLATERSMVRKFILDTIDLFLEEYHVDGFRFDLMGAIDIETMKQIEKRCFKHNVPIMLLGEGWELDTALPFDKKSTNRNAHQLQGVRFFNDYFRDTIKGSLFDQHETGYSNGKGRFIERMPHLISGSALEEYGEPFVSDINQTINYVECHDNHTLWDRLLLTNKSASEFERKKMHQLATGITLLSQGVPFLHAGQEWYRTKKGIENSYISNDTINQLDWSKREQEIDNIEFVKSLIALRKRYDVFRMTSKSEIRRRFHVVAAPHPVFGFMLLGEKNDFSIYINPTAHTFDIQLPSPGKWKRAVTNSTRKENQNRDIAGEYTQLSAFEIVVFQKTRKLSSNDTATVEASGATK